LALFFSIHAFPTISEPGTGYFDTLCDWLEKLVPLSQPIKSENKINRDLRARDFPALGASHVHLLGLLIG